MPRTDGSRSTKKDARHYWLWVTHPETYLDEDGNDREDLDPESGVASSGWWTCHKDTRKGDLVFLWRTTPKCDIGYLMQAKSVAYSIAEHDYASKQGWDYACDFEVLYKFKSPVTIQDLNQSPYVQDWGAYRANFQGHAFRIPSEHWRRLTQLASGKNPGYRKFIDRIEKKAISTRIVLEEQLEEALASDLSLLRPFGHNLELYIDSDGETVGRQLVCKGNGGRIDLLCYDRKKHRYVVIELKNVRASQITFGQIANYMGWVQDRIAKGVPVIGLVISRGYDTKFQSALKVTDLVLQLDIRELGFK